MPGDDEKRNCQALRHIAGSGQAADYPRLRIKKNNAHDARLALKTNSGEWPIILSLVILK